MTAVSRKTWACLHWPQCGCSEQFHACARLLNAPFALPADSHEIILDLPMPVSANRLHGHRRGHVYRTKQYNDWIREADALILLKRQFPKKPIQGPFEVEIWLAANGQNGDGDNRIKATLDYLQSRKITPNDKFCRKGRWQWVPTAEAPHGCRVHLRSLHEPDRTCRA